MANLIITVIAIALVAIASLMGAYYGGSAFLNNQSAANASTVLNQAQQIAGAWNAYLSDNLNVAPTSLEGAQNSLIAGKYLAQIPIVPAGGGGSPSQKMTVFYDNATNHYFAEATLGTGGANAGTVADNNAAACLRVIKTAIGPAQYNQNYSSASASLPAPAAGSIYNSAAGNGTFGCAYVAGGAASYDAAEPNAPGGYIMEYLLQ